MFFKYFLYFETYYVRDFKIMDSIEYSHQLSKANRLRKIIPEVIFILISIVFVFIISLGISKIFDRNYNDSYFNNWIRILGNIFSGFKCFNIFKCGIRLFEESRRRKY